MIQVGAKAPDFELPIGSGARLRLGAAAVVKERTEPNAVPSLLVAIAQK